MNYKVDVNMRVTNAFALTAGESYDVRRELCVQEWGLRCDAEIDAGECVISVQASGVEQYIYRGGANGTVRPFHTVGAQPSRSTLLNWRVGFFIMSP